MIAVTGAGGFVGGAIARALLARGQQVRAIQRSPAPALQALGAEVVQADLADRQATLRALAGCEAVLHVAAKAGVWGPYAVYARANIDATDNVLQACRAQGIGRLVYTSTPSVVHAGGDVEGADESAPYGAHAASAYAATKTIAEQRVLQAAGPDLLTVALRPHLVWGPGDTQLTARVIARARAGRLRLVGGGTKRIDATYIDNAAAAHLCALDALRPGAACVGQAYFIANNEPMPQKQLIDGMLAAAGLPPCTKSLPLWAAVAAGGAMEALWALTGRDDEPLLTRFVARQLGTAHWYNLQAAGRDLGYVPAISTEEGLRRLAAWFAAQQG